MELSLQREQLLGPLQMVGGAVEKRQLTKPILSHVLLSVNSHQVTMTATDLEIELAAKITLTEPAVAGETTVPARKLLDICRSLPAETQLKLTQKDHKLLVKAGKSRFTLATLNAEEFPNIEQQAGEYECAIAQNDLRYLIEATHFSMAQNDVRYYMNGLFLHFLADQVRAVTTDGHRLSYCRMSSQYEGADHQVILPRKAVAECLRLLSDSDETVDITLTANHFRITGKDFVFTTKLIEGKYPDYQQVIPQNCNREIILERDVLKDILHRVAILSNEKYRGVRLQFNNNVLKILANNPEQEEAEEDMDVDYQDSPLDIGFNVGYLLDVMNNIPPGEIKFNFNDSASSLLITSMIDPQRTYVIMPMRV